MGFSEVVEVHPHDPTLLWPVHWCSGPEMISGIQRLQIFHEIQSSGQNEEELKDGRILDALLLDQNRSRVSNTNFGAMTTCLPGKGHGHL